MRRSKLKMSNAELQGIFKCGPVYDETGVDIGEKLALAWRGFPFSTTLTENIRMAIRDYCEVMEIPAYALVERALIEYMSKYPFDDADDWTCGYVFYRGLPHEGEAHPEAFPLFRGPLSLPPR